MAVGVAGKGYVDEEVQELSICSTRSSGYQHCASSALLAAKGLCCLDITVFSGRPQFRAAF